MVAVQQELAEPTKAELTMAEQRQHVVELAADAWVLARRPPLAVSVVEVVEAVERCRM